jgi:hypothetical protein
MNDEVARRGWASPAFLQAARTAAQTIRNANLRRAGTAEL